MNKLQKQEWNFFGKVVRNSLILGTLYFVSVFATTEVLTYTNCKPIIVFIIAYIGTEMANRYGLTLKLPNNKRGSFTLIL